jgi:Tfp pilus assembly protein PilO
MKVESSTRTILAILVVVAAAVAFWMLLLSPKRKEADALGARVEGLQSTLAQSQSEVSAAEKAKRQFPRNYRQLVVLGKAVPAGDETASLLVQMNTVAQVSGNTFDSIQLGAEGGATSTETASTSSETPGSPSEAEAALLPLGATVGSAGLAVMPYDLIFTGSFFRVADFIKGIDSLVKTKGANVKVNGRLLTINGFSLEESESGFPALQANFSVTTYVVPPGQSLTAGATEAGPAESEVTGGTETTEGTPSASVSEPK